MGASRPTNVTVWRRQASERPVSRVRVTVSVLVDGPVTAAVSTFQTMFDVSVS